MGCFDGRCAITNMSIRHNEPVFAVAARRTRTYTLRDELAPVNVSTYKLLCELSEYQRNLTDGYRPHAWMGVDGALTRMIALQGRFLYDDYGWVAKEPYGSSIILDEKDPYHENYQIWMVHASVLDELLAQRPVRRLPATDPYYELAVLTHFAFETRIQLFTESCDMLLGTQHVDVDELDAHRLRLRLIETVIERRQNWFDDDNF